jgi:Family of unknown function (DUF5764)
MDDFNLSTLRCSRDEWCMRLINILSPQIISGIRSIFAESYKQCMENNEPTKYLATFQNYLSRIPKWNSELIEQESNRIAENSGCTYLDDLITCVHIIQLKMLTCVRVGTKQKKVDLDIPKVEIFIHKIYIHVARELYTKVYLFMTDVTPIEKQKNNHMIEHIVQNCIFNAIGESMPDKKILRAFLEETDETVEEVKEEIIKEMITPVKEEKPKPKQKPPRNSSISDTVGGTPINDVSTLSVNIPEIEKIEDSASTTSQLTAFTPLEGSPITSITEPNGIEEINLSGMLDMGDAISLKMDDEIMELN